MADFQFNLGDHVSAFTPRGVLRGRVVSRRMVPARKLRRHVVPAGNGKARLVAEEAEQYRIKGPGWIASCPASALTLIQGSEK